MVIRNFLKVDQYNKYLMIYRKYYYKWWTIVNSLLTTYEEINIRYLFNKVLLDKYEERDDKYIEYIYRLLENNIVIYDFDVIEYIIKRIDNIMPCGDFRGINVCMLLNKLYECDDINKIYKMKRLLYSTNDEDLIDEETHIEQMLDDVQWSNIKEIRDIYVIKCIDFLYE